MSAQGSLFDVNLPENPESWVYLIGVPGKSIAKIGTAQDVGKRLVSLQTSHHQRLKVLWKTPGAREMERMLHNHFSRKRLEGEWFDFGDEVPAEALQSAMLELNLAAVEESSQADDAHSEADARAIPLQGIEYSRYPADDDPDRDNPDYAPFHPAGCRYLTPTECASWGDPPDSGAFWKCCRSYLADH